MIRLKKQIESICRKGREIINNEKVIRALLGATMIVAVFAVGISAYFNTNSFFTFCAVAALSVIEIIGPKVFSILKEKKGWMIKARSCQFGLIIANIFIILVFSPFFRFPKVYTVKMQSIANSAVDYAIEVKSNLSTNKIVVLDNGATNTELGSFDQKWFKRVFSGQISIVHPEIEHKIEAKSLLPSQRQGKKGAYCIISPMPEVSPTSTPPIYPEDITFTCIPIDDPLKMIANGDIPPLLIPVVSTNSNAIILVETSQIAKNVVMYVQSETTEYGEKQLKKLDSFSWYFNADFYEESTFKIVVRVYTAADEYTEKEFSVKYPFS